MRFAEWLRFERSKYDSAIAERKLQYFFKEKVVINGYFKGIEYSEFATFGSSLFPKLSGNYESELFPFFKEIANKNYTSIIDVGCAEGFYAVGMAIKYPSANIFAYDIEEPARKLCRSLADFNGVGDRVFINAGCDSQTLKSLDAGISHLIICDCEGFERKLFNQDSIQSLLKSDLLIEMHPMHEPDVKKYLFKLFEKSHQLKIISSYDDDRKIHDLPKEFEDFGALERLKLVQEGRAFSMDWLIAVPKIITDVR